jgi:ABC-2 type transport system ATP-binding protein
LGRTPKEIKGEVEELLSLVGLADEKHRIKGYSRGMKQRLGIAQALIGSPKLLICDEPTSALDPIGRKEILDLLLSVRDRTTVLFSTHILSDVERICTDIALLHDGKIAMQGSVNELMRLRRNEEFVVETLYPNGADQLLAAFPNARLTEKDTVTFMGGEAEMFAVLAFMKEKNLAFQRVERMGTSLETLFLEVTQA